MFDNISSNFYVFLFLFLFSIQLTLTFNCYECNDCTDISSCTCNHSIEINDTDSYCILLRQSLSHRVHIEIKHVSKNLTRYYIYDPHYIMVEERIVYNDTTERWLSISNRIIYGCQTDYCNHADLLKELPSNGLSLMLPTDWLNENLQRKADQNPTLCRICDEERICGDSPETINITNTCRRQDCQGSCLTSEIFERAETTQLCYASDCSSGPDEILPEVFIVAFYYLNTQKFEITEINVICNADDCSHLTLFKDIKEKLQKDLNNIKPFLPNHVNSIYSISISFFIIILLLQIFIFY